MSERSHQYIASHARGAKLYGLQHIFPQWKEHGSPSKALLAIPVMQSIQSTAAANNSFFMASFRNWPSLRPATTGLRVFRFCRFTISGLQATRSWSNVCAAILSITLLGSGPDASRL